MGGKNSIKENFYLLLKHAILSVLMFVIYLFISSFSFLGESGKKNRQCFQLELFFNRKAFYVEQTGPQTRNYYNYFFGYALLAVRLHKHEN